MNTEALVLACLAYLVCAWRGPAIECWGTDSWKPGSHERASDQGTFDSRQVLEKFLLSLRPACAFDASGPQACLPLVTDRRARKETKAHRLLQPALSGPLNALSLATHAHARRASQPVAFLDNGAVGPVEIGVGVVLAGLLLSQLNIITAVVPLLLIFLSGDPDERAKDGNNEAVKQIIENYTPSAWKKAYLGENDVERGDGQKSLLDLPSWQGEEARELVEAEAVENVKAMQLETIDVAGVGPIDTCFISLKPEPSKAVDAPPLMLIHGFDSSVLEFRYVAPKLVEAGLRVEAMEWWTGGFTDRKPILEKVEAGADPWDLIRAHQYAFWKKQLAGEKAIVLGASLGGAVAMDFAVTHPECVDSLILMDAGGESYAQPNPILTSLAADPVTNLFQWRASNGLLPYPHVWSKEDSWRGALRAYLKSGGYERRVNPELIRKVPVPTKVLWGEEDDVLPVEDAYQYEKDLPNCVGVQLIPDAQHAPALENPAFVSNQFIEFAMQRASQLKEARTA
mmetsp:Transcript_148782/g.270793  ORF Transcript_148782/g.270793 Transcript_148782/m.270793 type:complete len:512 (-) Transcript_148782:120-1655(-)